MRVQRIVVIAALSLAVGSGLAACASSGGDASGSAAAAQQAPPPGSKLAKITVGMNDAEVRKILGEPDSANAYQTGKAWIPFYFGPDAARSDWIYKGQGRVVYSRNRYSGGLKVIRVIYNPAEAGG